MRYQVKRLWRRRSWKLLSAVLAIGWAITLWADYDQNEKIRLLRQVNEIQAKWCEGTARVNAICETTMADLAVRLGLDANLVPVVTTALWQRAMPNVSVTRARRVLGAKERVKERPLAIGGPAEEAAKR